MAEGRNDFLTFATDPSANVMSQQAYAEFAQRGVGQSGKALSSLNNKALRQGAMMAAVLGKLIADAGKDALDDGDIDALAYNLKTALNASGDTVMYDENGDVKLKGNITLNALSELLGTDPDGTEHVIGAIKAYADVVQNELANATNHTNINSLNRPTVEMPSGKKEIAFTDDIVSSVMSVKSHVYDTPGTYAFVATKPYILVFEATAGGGGGSGGGMGRSTGTLAYGVGGGAGDAIRMIFYPVIIGNTYEIVVGAGGAGGSKGSLTVTAAAGTAGGATSIDGLFSLAGGGPARLVDAIPILPGWAGGPGGQRGEASISRDFDATSAIRLTIGNTAQGGSNLVGVGGPPGSYPWSGTGIGTLQDGGDGIRGGGGGGGFIHQSNGLTSRFGNGGNGGDGYLAFVELDINLEVVA